MSENQQNVAKLDIHIPGFLGSPGMTGADMRQWRKRHGMTQEMLRQTLQIGSRQTIISWEKSTDRLPRHIEFALVALEHLPEKCIVTGQRYSVSEARNVRKRL